MKSVVITPCIRCGKDFEQLAWRAANPKHRKKTCSPKCCYRRHGTLEDRLLSKTRKTKLCWYFTGTKTPEGYGKLWDTELKEMGRAHRMAYELYVGPIPDGLQVCHHCDNPSCVNPQHLYLGTNDDNIRDKMQKGRGTGGRCRLDANVRTAIMALLKLQIPNKKISVILKVTPRTVRRYAALESIRSVSAKDGESGR